MRLAFLHGFPLDQTMWREQTAIFPNRCVAPNLYRLGSSLESWAAGALDAIGPGPVIAVGSSIGGSCAIEMARQSPDTISALVLLGSKAGHRPEPEARDRYIGTLRADGIRGMWPQVAGWLGPSATDNAIETIESIALAQNTDDLVSAVQVFHGRADLTHVVTGWEKPLLMVYGENDPIVSIKHVSTLARVAPNAKLHIMPGCGHFMNMERPREFNDVLAKFVKSIDVTCTE